MATTAGRQALRAIAVALFASGCGDRDAPRADVLQGLDTLPEVVSGISPPEAWHVEERPSLVIGEGEQPDQLLERPVAVVVSDDGEIVIGDAGSRNVRVFTAEGDLRLTAGSRGEGPGEFEQVTGVALIGDTLIVLDGALARLTFFSVRSGQLLGTLRPEEWGAGTKRLIGVIGGGLLIREARHPMPGDPEGIQRPPQVLRLIGGDGSTRRFVELPGPEAWASGGLMSARRTPLPWGATSALSAGAGYLFWLPDGSGTVIAWDATGAAVRRFGRRGVRRPLTRAAISAFATAYVDLFTAPDRKRSAARLLETIPYPDSVPAYNRILVAGDSTVWLSHFPNVLWPPILRRSASAWDVFSPGGDWLALVQVPDGLEVVAATRHSVLVRRATSLGEPLVQVHAIIRP